MKIKFRPLVTALDIVESVRRNKTITVEKVAQAIEEFAPKSLQESYDNSGLQIGAPDMPVTAVLLCVDFTEEILDEAIERECNMVISHHPLLFNGLKTIVGATPTQRMVEEAIKNNISLYSAHTNLDAAEEGVSKEMARMLGLRNTAVLEPSDKNPALGLGIIGDIEPTPKLEFLRTVKEAFNVKALKFSEFTPILVVKRVALCGGSGASMIEKAISLGADTIVTGDIKYHDYTNFGGDILIADTGHYESEYCVKQIFSRIIREHFPTLPIYFSERERNPISII